MNILHIDASITGDKSVSRHLSVQAVKSLRHGQPDAKVVYRDLVASPLPHLTMDVLGSPDGEAMLAEFEAADVVVIGAGMYNFSVPSQLKAWIDRILVAGRTFRYTDHGPEGLARAKRVVICLARGSSYDGGTAAAVLEHAETYLSAVLTFIGITDLEFITADGLALPHVRDGAIRHAEARAASLAV